MKQAIPFRHCESVLPKTAGEARLPAHCTPWLRELRRTTLQKCPSAESIEKINPWLGNNFLHPCDNPETRSGRKDPAGSRNNDTPRELFLLRSTKENTRLKEPCGLAVRKPGSTKAVLSIY